MQWIHIKTEYFGACWCRNREYCSAFGVTHTINTHKKGIFRCLLVPKYFGEYWFAFGIVCAVNTQENEIFRQLLAPEYFGEYCFAFGVTCALNTAAVGTEIFRRILLCLRSNMCTKYTWKWNIWATLGEHVHWIPVKVQSFSSSWCTSGMIVIPPSEYLHSIQVKMTYFSSLMF